MKQQTPKEKAKAEALKAIDQFMEAWGPAGYQPVAEEQMRKELNDVIYTVAISFESFWETTPDGKEHQL